MIVIDKPKGETATAGEKETQGAAGRAQDTGFLALCAIAGYFRIAADPVHLKRELALLHRDAREEDIVRRALSIGLKARVINTPDADHLLKAPTPYIARLRDGRFVVPGGRLPTGQFRLTDPVTRINREVVSEGYFNIVEPRLVLVTRRVFCADYDPRTFDFHWLANLLALPQSARPCADRVLLRLDRRARHATDLSGNDRQGSHASRLFNAPRHGWRTGFDRRLRRDAAIFTYICALPHHQQN